MKVLGKKEEGNVVKCSRIRNTHQLNIKIVLIGCDVDLNTTKNGSNDTTIIERKVVDNFNVLTKHMSNKDKKVILNEILNDPRIK